MAKRKRGGSGKSVGLDQRLAQVRACERSGETLKAYAERHGLSAQALYQAKSVARRRGLLPPKSEVAKPTRRPAVRRRPGFVEAVVARPAAPEAFGWRLRFAGGESLESNEPLSEEQALRLIDALRRQP